MSFYQLGLSSQHGGKGSRGSHASSQSQTLDRHQQLANPPTVKHMRKQSTIDPTSPIPHTYG
jgi:hypothetical protein